MRHVYRLRRCNQHIRTSSKNSPSSLNNYKLRDYMSRRCNQHTRTLRRCLNNSSSYIVRIRRSDRRVRDVRGRHAGSQRDRCEQRPHGHTKGRGCGCVIQLVSDSWLLHCVFYGIADDV